MATFDIEIEESLDRGIKKLKNKDKALYNALVKKILQLSERPYIGKPLRHVLKGRWRVHIGNFVLIYEIDEANNKVTLLEFEHHDKVYR